MGQISCFSRAASAASPSAPPPPPPCRQLRSTGSDMAAPLNFTSSCWDQKSVDDCSYLLWGWFLRCCMCDQKQNTWVTADLFTKHTDFSSVLWKSSCMDLKPAQDTLCNTTTLFVLSVHVQVPLLLIFGLKEITVFPSIWQEEEHLLYRLIPTLGWSCWMFTLSGWFMWKSASQTQTSCIKCVSATTDPAVGELGFWYWSPKLYKYSYSRMNYLLVSWFNHSLWIFENHYTPLFKQKTDKQN